MFVVQATKTEKVSFPSYFPNIYLPIVKIQLTTAPSNF